MSTLASRITFEEMLRIDDGKLYELVDGELVEKQMGHLSLWVATEIACQLKMQLEKAGLGWVSTETPINCFPWDRHHGRRPDVVYFAKQALPDGLPAEAPLTASPELVVEVISPSDNTLELDSKLEDYFAAKIKLVWVVFPETRAVHVYRLDGTGGRLRADQTIENEPALPGFRAKVESFFPPRTTPDPRAMPAS
jgi:Uma2 family endonuclease